MDFLARHYEKLILAVCLLCLIWSIRYVAEERKNASSKTDQVTTQLKTIVRGNKLVAPLDVDKLDQLDTMLNQPSIQLNLLQDRNSRNDPPLFEGGQYIVCKNPDCGYILPYSTATSLICPYCKTPQEVVGPEPTEEDDLDKDGIPDLVEKASKSLNYRNPYDGQMDFNGDGFLNNEEIRAQTDMNDAASRPALAYLLRRTGKAIQVELPFKLKRVKDSGGSPDPKEWKASLTYGNNPVPVDVKYGAEIPRSGGYTLVGFSDTKDSITIKDPAGATYTMGLNQSVNERAYSVTFDYLLNHSRQAMRKNRTADEMKKPEEAPAAPAPGTAPAAANPNGMMPGGAAGMPGARGMGGMGMGMGMGEMESGNGMMNAGDPVLVFTLHVGDVFVLEKTPNASKDLTSSQNTAKITEWYEVLPIQKGDGDTDIVQVQQITGEGGTTIGQPIDIPILNNGQDSHDFLPMINDTSAGGMEGGMPGMMPGMGMPGGMPGIMPRGGRVQQGR